MELVVFSVVDVSNIHNNLHHLAIVFLCENFQRELKNWIARFERIIVLTDYLLAILVQMNELDLCCR